MNKDDKIYLKLGKSFYISSANENILNLLGCLAQQLLGVLIVTGMNFLVELLVDGDDDIECSFLNGRRVVGALEKIDLRENQHLGALDEGIQFVLLGGIKLNLKIESKVQPHHAHFQMMNVELGVGAL